MEITKFEIIDNRNKESFDCGKWWGIVWFENGDDLCGAFDTKRDAKWFVNGGYKEYID